MRLLLDMNLSPGWVPYLHSFGFDTVHWSTVGAGNAPDSVIMQWARDHGSIVFTHDLDFGILLAHSKDSAPSVIQVRAQDVSPGQLGSVVVAALRTHREALVRGALLTIELSKSRIRILPV
jgi:predicted nuclease of predicted toxin-antitoxin system